TTVRSAGLSWRPTAAAAARWNCEPVPQGPRQAPLRALPESGWAVGHWTWPTLRLQAPPRLRRRLARLLRCPRARRRRPTWVAPPARPPEHPPRPPEHRQPPEHQQRDRYPETATAA